MIIPKDVESKIRYTCSKISNIEWSGILFYTYEGNFEDESLIIRCVDIFIMDIGTTGYTEFEMNPDVISYMTENPELLSCKTGLIHSHHEMSTFFSHTDTSTLASEGHSTNNFVSLIVNNAGTYTAAITRKVKYIRNINELATYEFFDQGTKNAHKEYKDIQDNIEWYYLKIEKEGANIFEDIQNRLDEIQKSKEITKIKQPELSSEKRVFPKFNMDDEPTLFDDLNKSKKVLNSISNCIKKDSLNTLENIQEEELKNFHLNEDILKAFVVQLLTGSLFVGVDKLDIDKWVSKMKEVYSRRFKNEESFSQWIYTFIDYLIWEIEDPELSNLGLNSDELAYIVANDAINALNKFPQNVYINDMIEQLENYLVI
jgi:proteasome lid subunit RPN8/RPN11